LEEVRWGGLVRDQDQPRVGSLAKHAGKGTEQNGLVSRPGRPRHQGRRSVPEPEQWVLGGDCLYPRDHAIESRVAQDLYSLRSDAQPLEPGCIAGTDRGGRSDGAVTGLQQPPSEPAKTAAPRAYRGRYESYVGPPAGRAGGQLGPDIELGKDQKVGLQCSQQPVHVLGEIVREVIRDIGGYSLGQRLSRGTEMGIHDLTLGAPGTQREQDALGLAALSHRGGMKPGEGAVQVPVPSGPVQQPFTGIESGLQTSPDPRTKKAHCGSHRCAKANGSSIGP
jgi:hypothetical protein